MNSLMTSFNRKNSTIIKIHSFMDQIMTAIAKIHFIFKTISLKYQGRQITHFFDAFILLISIPSDT